MKSTVLSVGYALTLGALLLTSPARADAPDDVTLEARARFQEGVSLYDQGRYEAARAKFKQAYALKKHPDVLLNLGWSNLKSGHKDEAQTAFSDYLRDPNASPSKRGEAERGLAEAKGEPSAPSSASTTTTTGADVAAQQATAPPAEADKPAEAPQPSSASDARPIRADALFGFSSDNLNVGLGLRGGKVVASHVYVGGTFVYNIGDSYSTQVTAGVPGLTPTYTGKASFSAFYIGPEVGYEFELRPVILRPYGGIGLASLSTTVTSGNTSVSSSDTRLVFWPGVACLYDVPGSMFTVGGDARFVVVPGGPAFGVFATGGMRF
jgi:hypothetical protein